MILNIVTWSSSQGTLIESWESIAEESSLPLSTISSENIPRSPLSLANLKKKRKSIDHSNDIFRSEKNNINYKFVPNLVPHENHGTVTFVHSWRSNFDTLNINNQPKLWSLKNLKWLWKIFLWRIKKKEKKICPQQPPWEKRFLKFIRRWSFWFMKTNYTLQSPARVSMCRNQKCNLTPHLISKANNRWK